MIENTNTKQFYPGPILNNTLEITDFLFNDAEQIKITHSKLNGEGILVNVDLNYPTDYEVIKVLPSDINAAEAALTASTGQIILKNINVLTGEKLTVYRVSQIVQNKDYPRTGAFPAATHEGALDYLTMQNQEQSEELARSLKVPISTPNFNAAVPIPLPNRILRINEEASGFEFVPYDLDERLDTFEDTVIDNITAGQEAIENSFEEFKNEANITINNIDIEVTNAIDTANTANAKSDEAIDIANTASAAATNAVNTSNSAVASANTAVATANNADTKSDEALLTSQEAREASVIAEENATTAKEKVDIFEQNIETVLEAADQIAQLESAIDAAIQAAEDATQAAEDAIQAAEDAEASLSEKADKTDLNTHISNKSNPHSVTKTQVGLGNVDNTSDINKPISTATQTALNNKLDKTGTAVKATADASGNNIVNTYATKIALDSKVDIDDMVAIDLPSPRNIGEYVWSSIPLTDAALHLPDGTILDGNGINKDFVNVIADIYPKYPSLFVSESDWQASVEQYGTCGKYVYNQANNTVRLPKVTGHVEGTLDANALGDLIEAGLPNITGFVPCSYRQNSGNPISGAFYDAGYSPSNGADDKTADSFGFDASRSNPIYGKSNTVQTQSILGYMYIVVATTTKTDIEVDIDNIATDLNNKVDVSNMVEVPTIIESYVDGASGCNIYSNGYCEQWGFIENTSTSTGTFTVTLLEPYSSDNYNIVTNWVSTGQTPAVIWTGPLRSQEANSFTIAIDNKVYITGYHWSTKGYIK